MTLEDHLRRMIGDLVFTTARLAADNDALNERLTAATAEQVKTKSATEKAPQDAGAPV